MTTLLWTVSLLLLYVLAFPTVALAREPQAFGPLAQLPEASQPRSPEQLPEENRIVAVISREAAPTGEMDTIPDRIAGKDVTSWSLFLPCNPTWLLPEKAQTLSHLHENFIALGKATGSHHAAVWFFKGTDKANLDVVRSADYCKRFGLAPSNGPFIVMTLVHPDKWSKGDRRVVLGSEEAMQNESQ